MRLFLNSNARALLRRLPAVNFYSLAELVLLAVLAIQTPRLIWTVVTPVGPLGDWRIAQPGVPGSPLTVLKGFDPFFRNGAPTGGGDATITSLQLKLFGTRIDDATGQSSAIIAGPDGVQNSIGVGQEILPGAILKSVAFDHVTIDRGGRTEDLYIDQSGAAPAADAQGDAANAQAAAAPSATDGVTPAQIKSDVAFIPRIDGGRITGLTVRPQGNGAGFNAIGLKEGDVIVQVGGRAINGQADLDRVVSGMTPGTNLSLTVERGAQTLPLAVMIRGQ